MMLAEYLPNENIVFSNASRWQDAIEAAAQPLLTKQLIKLEYIDAIKTAISNPGGTYMDLGYGITLAHARPENGALQTALSLASLSSTVFLNDNADHPMRLVFILAASDSTSHLSLMRNLSLFLGDQTARENLIQAKSISEISELLARF
ncbi:PTS sugar transporter subunit IIA [Cutibacterium sp. WCA-380-WT-3A]|uniref:Ascorbate-specific PTS system EIIA component n=1 Tax=Cutibacterium porci TaxID=2605781 RepID=A0A7K0J457_9ACTN|nr:PTS sugar transporter subunit IIA [Cutibacterium porci]MSS44721.1 PTS sugar transporter subunit IIA [Cutibacterium porci]